MVGGSWPFVELRSLPVRGRRFGRLELDFSQPSRQLLGDLSALSAV